MHTSARRLAGLTLALTALALARPGAAQPKGSVLPPTDKAPRLVLAHPAAHAPVNALAFAPDGTTLYAAGFDKHVRRYRLGGDGAWAAAGTFRVPVGPGNGGVINALAVSPDGKWVAAAGRAPIRGEVWTGPAEGLFEDYRDDPDDVRGDAGIVYLFAADGRGAGRAIRGPLRGVRALAFADPAPAAGPVLVTAGIERVKGVDRGVLRVFDADTGEQKAAHAGLPASTVPPTVVAFATGKEALRVAVAWDAGDGKPGKLMAWDNPGPLTRPVLLDDTAYNSTLAVRFDGGAPAELLSGGFDGKQGGFTARDPDGKAKRFDPLPGKKGEAHLPAGVVATAKGVAVLAEVAAGKDSRYELRLLAANAAPPVVLKGLAGGLPVLAASADGNFAAVAGFADNRLEIYPLAALAAGKAGAPQVIAGTEPGYEKVAFLAGEKLWLGKRSDSATKGGGGVILDLAAKVRSAIPRGPNEELAVDAPDAPAPEVVAKAVPARVRVPLDGGAKEVVLPAGAVVTAAAVLPAKRGWDEGLGAAVAVAVVLPDSRDVQLKLYRLADVEPPRPGEPPRATKPLYVFGGPTLPLTSLAFSNARPLLAGAGEGTVAVWSLKGVANPTPAVEGLLLTTRKDKVVVSVVKADSPAKGKLQPNDAIDSVKDAKGDAQEVKVPGDFVQTVRTLKVGADALVTANGKEVAVKVGTATGFRLPLFNLWASPVAAKDGTHPWVGWTPSGPYDASGKEAEDRVGWLKATGEAADPAQFVPIGQHRQQFYRPDFIRQLLVTGGYRPPNILPRAPAFGVKFPDATDHPDGRRVTRAKIDAAVTLDDPDGALDPALAVVAWRLESPDGSKSEWVRESFARGQVVPKLTDRAWARGAHTVRARLFATAAAPAPLFEAAESVAYIPPKPEFALLIDGKAVAPNDVVTVVNGKAVAVSTDPKFAPAAATVKVSWTGAKSEEELKGPHAVPLADGKTEIVVTATNAGADPNSDAETAAVRVWVSKEVVPKPAVALDVLDSIDPRPNAADPEVPYVVTVERARLRAAATAADPITKFEWKVGAGPWEEAKLVPDAERAKAGTNVRVVVFSQLKPDDFVKDKAGNENVRVQARATGKGGVSESSLWLRRDGMPEISVDAPPAVSGPEMQLKGGLKVTSKRAFAVRVRVTSSRTGQTREFAPTPNAALTAWTADLTLFPGGNQLGYVVRYDSGIKEQLFDRLVEVHYAPRPVALGGGPVDVDTGDAGALGVAVAATGTPPELLVGGAPVGTQSGTRPIRLFGLSVWAAVAPSVPANPGDEDRLKPIAVAARNSEGTGEAVPVEVKGEPRVRVAPPVVAVRYAGGPIAHGDALTPTGDPDFPFEFLVKSDVPLTRAEVWHGRSPDAVPERVESGAGGLGKVVSARPTVRLRPGAENYVKVVVSNGGRPIEVGFSLTYLPPAVQVVIDSIRDRAAREPTPVTRDNMASLKVNSGVIEVRGRVVWHADGEAVATDPNLAVAFVANGVAHVPVPVSKAVPGAGRVREFSGWVYLNSSDPTPGAAGTAVVRAELRSGPAVVPRAAAEPSALSVTSARPITRQRLHVLIFGVGVSEKDRVKLVQGVVTAIGGRLPPNDPNFSEGRFERDRFELAQVYRARFSNAQTQHLTEMLERVHADIKGRVRRVGGDDEWVNDVILLYYHGSDWQDASGRWLLDTATTAGPRKGPTAADEAIRRDALPSVPGMLVVVANVTGRPMKADPLAGGAPYLRYAWDNEAARNELLSAIDAAVKARRKVDEIRATVAGAVREARGFVGVPIDVLPDEVLERVVGLK